MQLNHGWFEGCECGVPIGQMLAGTIFSWDFYRSLRPTTRPPPPERVGSIFVYVLGIQTGIGNIFKVFFQPRLRHLPLKAFPQKAPR